MPDQLYFDGVYQGNPDTALDMTKSAVGANTRAPLVAAVDSSSWGSEP